RLMLGQLDKWRRVAKPLRAEYQRKMDTWLTRQLNMVQIVIFWRVEAHGIVETAVPRLDSVERCLAYVIGLWLLDRHSLGRAIKQCPLIEDPDGARELSPGQPNYATLPPWFLQLPTSKRRFCSDRHRNAFDQRAKRARDSARKHK